jgi:hypothetical protein
MSFSSDIARFVAKTTRKNNAIVRKIVIDLGTSLVLKTPVGNPTLWQNPEGAPEGYAGGAARANWQYGNGEMPEGVLDLIDKGGNSTINRIIGGVQASPAASIHWIANNLPYMKRLEEEWSKQAPQGMLRLTVTEFEQTVRDAIKNVN